MHKSFPRASRTKICSALVSDSMHLSLMFFRMLLDQEVVDGVDVKQ